MRKLIQGWDAAFALPSFGIEGRLRRFSRPAQGARRQYRDGRFRSVGVRDVFHAERVLSGLPAHAGERPGPLQLPDAVRHRENSVRQLHPRHAGRGGPGAACSPVSSVMESLLAEPRDAASLRPAGRKDPDRLGRNGVLLLAETRLPALPDAQALQRQDRELSLYAVGDGRGARPFQGRAADAGVHRAAGRRRKAGLRAQRRQALVRQARRAASPVAPRLSRRRSVRLPARRQDDQGRRRRFHLHLQGNFAQDAVRLHRRAPSSDRHEEKVPQAQYERDAPLSLDRGGPAARRQGRDAGQLDRLRDLRRQGQRQISPWPG